MNWTTLAAVVPLCLGALAIFVSLRRSAALFASMPFVMDRSRPALERFRQHHRFLLIFFVVQYGVMAYALIMGLPFINDLVVTALFFLVAVFIHLSTVLESRLLLEIQHTLFRLLPVCSICGKARAPDADPARQESWMAIEQYVARETGSVLTHGICPECSKSVLAIDPRTRVGASDRQNV